MQLVALGGIEKSLDIESKLFFALFVFCSGAVPSYSSHSQNTKFISLYQSLTVFYKIYTRATPSLIAASATAFATVSLILSSNA